MIVSDRFLPTTPQPPAAKPVVRAPQPETSVAPLDGVQISPTQCPTNPIGSHPLCKQGRAGAEQAASALAGPTGAATAQVQADFRQGLCPYLASVAKEQGNSALDAWQQALQDGQLDPSDFFEKVGALQAGQVRIETNPDVVEEVLVKTGRDFEKSPFQVHSLGSQLGEDTIFLVGGESWKSHREALKPFFLGQPGLRGEIEKNVAEVIDQHMSRWPEGPVDLNKAFRKLTLDAVFRHMFHCRLEDGELDRAVVFFENAGNAATDKLFGRTASSADLSAERDWLTDRILQGDSPMLKTLKAINPSQQSLQDEILTLGILGHETTANLLTWSVAEMVRHPELAATEPKSVLRETARAHPPNYLLMRQATRDVQLEAGPMIPKGTQVFMPIETINEGSARTFSFGAGERVCLGQFFARTEATMVLSELWRRFEVSADDLGPLRNNTAFSSAPEQCVFHLKKK